MRHGAAVLDRRAAEDATDRQLLERFAAGRGEAAFAVLEIGIERFACFLDERDFAMFEPLATANDEQPAPC